MNDSTLRLTLAKETADYCAQVITRALEDNMKLLEFPIPETLRKIELARWVADGITSGRFVVLHPLDDRVAFEDV